MRKLFASLTLFVLFTPLLRADDGIPVETLKEIKAATVFVKVATARLEGSGSGFLMKVDGETGYIATNHHVIAPPQGAGALKSLQVVFNSGRKDEKVVNAEIVASDSSRDLAILKVTGVKELAKPIDLSQKVELIETMSVYVFGFPFGEALSTTKGNPAMTVGKGTVSSIRENEFNELSVVQIDGDINPGNSGGPVVDSKGRLIGVTVAKITNTRIGFAIPPGELTKMLAGRVGGLVLKTVKVENGVAEVDVEMQLIDPFNKIQSGALHFLLADKLKNKIERDKEGKWPLLPNSEKVDLKIDKQKAVGKFKVECAKMEAVAIAVQTEIVNGDGATLLTGPSKHNINFAAPAPLTTTLTPTPLPMPGGATPDPKATNDALLDETRKVVDLTVMDLKLETTAPRCLLWSEDGKSFYHLTAAGTLRRVALAGMTEEAKLDIGKVCSWLSLSSEGLVLTVTEMQEVWLLDPATLKVKKKFAVPSAIAAAASPKSAAAYAVARGDWVRVLDLKAGTVVKEYTRKDFENKLLGFERPAVSPDGKYLFTLGFEVLHRFKIEDNKTLTYDESSPRIASGRLEGIDVSHDSTLVCIASGGGNPKAKDHPDPGPYATYIYDISDLKKPVTVIKSGAYPEAIGFDMKAKLIYAHNFKKQLIVFTLDGLKGKEYELGTGGVRQLLAHPDGRKLIVFADKKISYVELPKP